MVFAFGNATAIENRTLIWVDEPDVRGSWSLLSSCVITISLCAWTALHLNVPEHGTASRQWMRKCKWLLVGLTAPELVAYIAWRQRVEAEALSRDVRAELGQSLPLSRCQSITRKIRSWFTSSSKQCEKDPSSATSSPMRTIFPHPTWTITHGFYSIMGGFAISSPHNDPDNEPFLPAPISRAALTADGLRFLLAYEPDLLPTITEEQIQDKSKADGVKKFLVCVQATWFVAACVTRVANRLPISLLELNAMAHALCSLAIYLMWWHKPLDVDEPTILEGGSRMKELAAYMWMGSKVGGRSYKGYDVHGRIRDEFDAIWPFRDPDIADLVAFRDHEQAQLDSQSPSPAGPDSNYHLDQHHREAVNSRQDRHYNHYTTFPANLRYKIMTFLDAQRPPFWFHPPAGLGRRNTLIDHLSSTTISRWQLAHAALTRYSTHLPDDLLARHCHRSELVDQASRLALRIPNHVSLFSSSSSPSRPQPQSHHHNNPTRTIHAGFTLAGFLYGGLHLLAWSAPFLSNTERILWRIAAVSVVATAVALAPMLLWFEDGVVARGGADLWAVIRGRERDRCGARYRDGRRVDPYLPDPPDDGRAGSGGSPTVVTVADKGPCPHCTHAGGSAYWFRIIAAALLLPLVCLSPLLGFLYVLGRIYLVVECFVNFTHLPAGVFLGVGWPAYISHIN